MNIPLYDEELFDFFQRSHQENIFSFREKGDVSLQNLEPSYNNSQQSIKAINGIVNALVHLRMNYIIPCQIKNEYVIRKNGVWGLRHVICDRDPQGKKQEGSYDPEEYKYHMSSQNQLMWNIGKIWLRFFTRNTIRMKYDRTEKINKIITENVPDKNIMKLIMNLLNRDPRERIGFQEFLQDDFFILETPLEEINQTCTSIFSAISYFKAMSMVDLETSTGKLTTLDIQNPFVKEIRYRCFFEYLDVDLYFQHVKGQIKELYFDSEDQEQKDICFFSLYIMELQNYFNMIRLNKERLQIGQRFDELEHRLYLSRFSKRMVKLRQELQKMAKKLKSSSVLGRDAQLFCKNIDDLAYKDVYNKFKKVLVEYAQYLNADLKKDKNDLVALKLLVKIYIIRTSSYVFSEMRSEVFEPFLRIDRVFNLKKVLARINESTDKNALRQLLNNIKSFYFSP